MTEPFSCRCGKCTPEMFLPLDEDETLVFGASLTEEQLAALKAEYAGDKYIIVHFNDNWADEFDVRGTRIWTKEDWQEHKDLAKDYFDKGHVLDSHFGTNESIEYNNYNEYMRPFTEVQCTDEEAKVLMKFAQYNNSYGTFLMEEDWYIDPDDED